MKSDLYARLAATGKPECPQCGYSLEGLPGPHRCPECGRPYGRDILTWRPSFRWWWLGIVSGVPALAYVTYNGWKSGTGTFIVILIAVVLAGWAHALWRHSQARERDHVSIDEDGISYCFGGKVFREFEWKKIHALTHQRFWKMIDIELCYGERHRLPTVLFRKDATAFVEAANNCIAAAIEQERKDGE